ncbi:Gfo/Idh/MocA family protein [Pseudonocardia sp. CA-107938]|uniref:Gfo/Idh/MocA family protein n=1 Tax=Pseudonocardia sp. CA-107938 TaxID=3240021 RepID=UPI003D8E2B77
MRIALVGVHGYGQVHLERLIELAAADRVRIAGLADPRPPDADVLERVRAVSGDVPVAADAASLLADVRADVTIVSTPIHTHLPLARLALAAGSHVLVEKPPTSSMEQFDELTELVADTGLACQVGFQSFGSRALAHAARLVADGQLGTVRGIGVHGAWTREPAYFERAPWAGRMRLGDVPVTDGALTNAYAHAVATALRLLGTPDDAELDVQLERFRAMSPEGDDTAAVRILGAGVPVLVAVTLCAATGRDPLLVVHGDGGRLELAYTRDTLTGQTVDGSPVTPPPGRVDLLENLLEHVTDPGVPLLSPLSGCRPFMQVLDAVRRDGPARPLPARVLRVADGGRTVVTGVDEHVRRCAEEMKLFSELPVDWSS